MFPSVYRQGWTFECHPEIYSSGSLLKGTAIPKTLKFLPAYGEAALAVPMGLGAVPGRGHLCPEEPSSHLRGCCALTSQTHLNEPAPLRWFLGPGLAHPALLCPVALRHVTLRPDQSFSSDQERASVPHVCPVPRFGRATSKCRDWLASTCNYTRRCTTITNGNSAQETSTEPAWGKTSQHDLFPCTEPFVLRCTSSQLSLITSLDVHRSSSLPITQGTHVLNS